jgi:hypothetical protein
MKVFRTQHPPTSALGRVQHCLVATAHCIVSVANTLVFQLLIAEVD